MEKGSRIAGRAGLVAGLCACAAVTLLCGLTGFSREVGYRFVWALALAGLWYAGRRFWLEPDRRLKACFGTLGALFTLALALGLRLDFFEETGWSGLGMSLALALVAAPAVGEGFVWLYRALSALKPGREAQPRKVFWLSLGLLLLGWLPVLLAYWPGIYAYDLDGQLYQVLNHAYTTHHPLLHTLLVGGLYTLGGLLGSHNLGALMYVILQAFSLALSMAYALSYLARIRCPRVFRLAVLGLFCLAPHHALLAIGCTKDVLFAACTLVYAVFLHRSYREPHLLRRRGFAACMVLLALGMCLTRNNALYALVLMLPAAILLLRPGMRLRFAALLCAALAASVGINAGLKAATDAVNGSIVEMLSVPAQQLSRVHAKYGYDHPVSYEIDECVPNAYRYRAQQADLVKLHLSVKTPEKRLKLFKLWVREFFHYPVEYVDAFLYNAKGLWYINDTSFASVYGEGLDRRTGAIITEMYEDLDVSHHSLFPALEALYERLFSANEYQRVPVLSLLLCPALYTWLLAFALCVSLHRRDRAAGAAGCMLGAYLLTLFLGPCVLVRYVYFLMAALPVLFGMLFAPAAPAAEADAIPQDKA